MGYPPKIKEKEAFLKWVVLTQEELKEQKLPLNIKAEAKKLGVALTLAYEWKKLALRTGLIIKPIYKEQSKDEREKEELLDKLYKESMVMGCPANKIEVFAKLKGWLKPSLDLNLGLSADEIARRNLEATKQLKEGGY